MSPTTRTWFCVIVCCWVYVRAEMIEWRFENLEGLNLQMVSLVETSWPHLYCCRAFEGPLHSWLLCVWHERELYGLACLGILGSDMMVLAFGEWVANLVWSHVPNLHCAHWTWTDSDLHGYAHVNEWKYKGWKITLSQCWSELFWSQVVMICDHTHSAILKHVWSGYADWLFKSTWQTIKVFYTFVNAQRLPLTLPCHDHKDIARRHEGANVKQSKKQKDSTIMLTVKTWGTLPQSKLFQYGLMELTLSTHVCLS